MDFTENDNYVGSANNSVYGLELKAWSCISLAQFMIGICGVAETIQPNKEGSSVHKSRESGFRPVGTTSQTSSSTHTGTKPPPEKGYKPKGVVDPITALKISKVSIKPHMKCFTQGNVITEGVKERRIAFDSHYRAKIDGVLYDPLMGESGSRADSIWEPGEVKEGFINIEEVLYKYKKLEEREGPIPKRILKKATLQSRLKRLVKSWFRPKNKD